MRVYVTVCGCVSMCVSVSVFVTMCECLSMCVYECECVCD